MPFAYEEDIASIICAYCQRQMGDTISLPGWRPPIAGIAAGNSGDAGRINEGSCIKQFPISGAKKGRHNRRPKHCVCDAGLVATRRCCWRKCCGNSAWRRESFPDICVRRTKKFVARKVRCMHGRKCFCRAPVGSGLTRRTVSFAMIISLPAAVGLRPADITPISGSFYHRDRVPAEMKSRLELITL